MPRTLSIALALSLFAGCAPEPASSDAVRDASGLERGTEGPQKFGSDRRLEIDRPGQGSRSSGPLRRMLGGQEGEPVWNGDATNEPGAIDSDETDGDGTPPPPPGEDEDTADTGL